MGSVWRPTMALPRAAIGGTEDASVYIRRLARLVRATLEDLGIDGAAAYRVIHATPTAREAIAVAGRFVVFAGHSDAP